MILISVYTIRYLINLNGLIESVIRQDSRLIIIAEDALEDLYNMTAADDKYLISGDYDYLRQFEQIRDDFAHKVKNLAAEADTEIKSQILTEIRTIFKKFDAVMAGRKKAGNYSHLQEKNRGRYVIAREEIMKKSDEQLRRLLRVFTQDRDKKLQQLRDKANQAVYISVVAEIVVILLVLLITFLNARAISLPIRQLREKTKDIASGKLEKAVEIPSPPEIKELAEAFNIMCDRLKELDQLKIDYINHLSHELRTPLTVIKEASLMLEQGVFSEHPEKQKELFQLIKEECASLISSVNRILDFSRLEAGDTHFAFQQADIRPVIAKSINKLSLLLRNKKMNVVENVSGAIPSVRMDAEKIEEVMENLLSNAWKYTQEGGTISVSALYLKTKNTVEISVEDNGKGIPEDGLQKVFDKFQRVDDHRAAIRGTGLGLAIVRHIINAHGGQIWVKSKIGEGSAFTFSLPVQQ